MACNLPEYREVGELWPTRAQKYRSGKNRLKKTAGKIGPTPTTTQGCIQALTQPDARDFMGLPHQDIDWPGAVK